jgi:hypothetical protein
MAAAAAAPVATPEPSYRGLDPAGTESPPLIGQRQGPGVGRELLGPSLPPPGRVVSKSTKGGEGEGRGAGRRRGLVSGGAGRVGEGVTEG